VFGYRKYLDNRTNSVIEVFGYRKCIFGISITERSVIEVLLYGTLIFNACTCTKYVRQLEPHLPIEIQTALIYHVCKHKGRQKGTKTKDRHIGRKTDKNTGRQKGTKTKRQIDRQKTDKNTGRQKYQDKQTDRRQTDRDKQAETNRQRQTDRDKQTVRQTDRKTNRQRQTDRDRQTETNRQKDKRIETNGQRQTDRKTNRHNKQTEPIE
jgi:hypothetical protein